MLALPLARVTGGRQSPWERCDRAMSRPALASMPRRPRWRARRRCTAPGELCRPKCWGGAVRQQAVEDQQVTGLHGDELHGPGQGVHIRAPGLRPSGAVRRHSAKCAKSCGMHRRPPPSSGVSGKASTPCTFTGNGSVQTRRYCHGREVSGLMRHSRPTRTTSFPIRRAVVIAAQITVPLLIGHGWPMVRIKASLGRQPHVDRARAHIAGRQTNVRQRTAPASLSGHDLASLPK